MHPAYRPPARSSGSGGVEARGQDSGASVAAAGGGGGQLMTLGGSVVPFEVARCVYR